MKLYSKVLPGDGKVYVLHINVSFSNLKRSADQIVLSVIFDPKQISEQEKYGSLFKILERKLRDDMLPKIKKGRSIYSLKGYIYRMVRPFLNSEGLFIFFLCDNYGNAVKYDNKLSNLCYYGIEFDRVYSSSTSEKCLKFEPGCMVLIRQKDFSDGRLGDSDSKESESKATEMKVAESLNILEIESEEVLKKRIKEISEGFGGGTLIGIKFGNVFDEIKI